MASIMQENQLNSIESKEYINNKIGVVVIIPS